MGREWKPGSPVPDKYSGMSVTFSWNDVALTRLLSALREGYPSGYAAMCDAVREAMHNFTPPRPEEPTGLGAVVEDDRGERWVLIPGELGARPKWFCSHSSARWSGIDAVRILSDGVQP